jgi:CHAT domain-containing protein/Tfp pilus assembly protein PilF
LQAALATAQDPQTRIVLWEALGQSYQYANEMAHAEASFRSALEAGETAWGESLLAARMLSRLGNVLRLQSRLDEAAQLQARGLEIRQRWAPDSLEVVDSLHQLFALAYARRDPAAMSELFQRAWAIQERWPPDSLAMADTLTDLSTLEEDRHRDAEAAAALARAVAILERKVPESIQLATILGRLGRVVRILGDLESAEELLQRALAIRQKLAPESLGTAAILGNFGHIALERGDLAAAAKHFQRSLEIWGKADPNGPEVASGFNALGSVARLRGDLDEAWILHHRAWEISEQFPNRFLEAFSLRDLGMVAEARGDLKLALDFHQRSLSIEERLAPGTIDAALALQQLGRLHHRAHRLDQAAQYLLCAVDSLENQMGRLGGSQDLQANYRARYEEIYRNAIAVELERGHAAEAFHLVERSRARSFLTLLSERDFTFSGELPEALERSRRDNAKRYDQTLHQLARWTPAAGEEARETFHRELSRLRRERNETAAEIRKASPRLAALHQPQPLDLAAAREVLDRGTLALSYSVGENQTALFAVTRDGGLRVETLPIGEERLHRDVLHFLERIQSQEKPVDLARSLYRTLIGPVADLVERSERVLILPDGPLHRLPFGALIRDTDRGQYLAEWKPLHSALSLTVYGTLRASESAPSSSTTAVVAFGDPRYSRDLAASGETRNLILRSPRLRSVDWAALPYSRREVERIAEVYPGARLYLGEDATEERAKTVGRDVRVLHFSTHGYLDDRTPLDSALVLTIPEGLPAGRDNGLLQVWEIFESVRLDADLVVLSACESALGREMSGEGLIGLTRAFQFAGARSVVASLWSVTDQVTAELMARFHRHYAAGLSKDESMRQAQIELMRQPIRITAANGQTLEMDASGPFFWAAFQVFGDWR